MKIINKIHHVAIIASNYKISKEFYTKTLGLEVVNEVYREEKKSYKLDLAIGDYYQIELFSFENPAKRLSYPEATGLRHLAFETDSVVETRRYLIGKGVKCQEVEVDSYTDKKFFFTFDPDMLPIEFYEV